MRVAAFILDSMIAGILSLIASFPISAICRVLPGDLGNQAILFQYTGKDILHYLVWAGYFVIFTYATGKTLGKRAMNLRVINADGTLQLSLVNVIFRETVGRFLCSVIAGVGYLLVGADTEKRGLHDRICDTRVVYEKTIPVRYKYSGIQEKPAGGYVPKLQPETDGQPGLEPEKIINEPEENSSEDQ